MAISRELQAVLNKIKNGLNLNDAELEALKKALEAQSRTKSAVATAGAGEFAQRYKDLLAENEQRKEGLEFEEKLHEIRNADQLAAVRARDADSRARREEIGFEEEKLRLLEAMEPLNKAEEEWRDALVKHQVKQIQNLKIANEKLATYVDLMNAAASTGEQMGKDFAGMFGLSSDGFAGMLSKAFATGDAFEMLGNVGLGIGAELQKAFDPTVILGSLLTRAVETFAAIDQLNEELYTETGIENLGFQVSEFSQDIKLLDNASEEMTATLKSMQTEFQGFYDLSRSAQQELAQTSAIMVKLGVDASATANSTGFLVTAMGFTTDAAEKTNREMVTLAHSLSLPPGQVMESFNAAQKTIAKYGKSSVVEFKRMQAASKTLNMDVGGLLDTMAGMDTFESAANMAGDLNAMLGGPFLNSMELLGQSESERLVTLSKTLAAQGTTFDQMSKFQRQGIAKTLGMDVDELGKLMAKAPEEIEAAMADAEAEAKSREELAKKAEEMMGIMSQFAMEIRDIFKAIFKEIFGEADTMVFIKGAMTALFWPLKQVVKLVKFVNEGFDRFFDILGVGDGTLASIGKTLGVLAMSFGALKVVIKTLSTLFMKLFGNLQMVQTAITAVKGAVAKATGAASSTLGTAGTKVVGDVGTKVAGEAGGGLLRGALDWGKGMLGKGGSMLTNLAGKPAEIIGNLLSKIPGGGLLGRLGNMFTKIPVLASLIEGIFAYGDIKSAMADPEMSQEQKHEAIGTRVLKAVAGVGGGTAATALFTGLTGGAGALASSVTFMAGDLMGKYLVDGLVAAGMPTAPLGEMIYNWMGPGSGIKGMAKGKGAAPAAMGAPQPVNDFIVGPQAFRPSSSDETVGLKEGGILARKLDKIADLLTTLIDKGGSTVIEMDGKRVGQAVVRSINNDLYSLT